MATIGHARRRERAVAGFHAPRPGNRAVPPRARTGATCGPGLPSGGGSRSPRPIRAYAKPGLCKRRAIPHRWRAGARHRTAYWARVALFRRGRNGRTPSGKPAIEGSTTTPGILLTRPAARGGEIRACADRPRKACKHRMQDGMKCASCGHARDVTWEVGWRGVTYIHEVYPRKCGSPPQPGNRPHPRPPEAMFYGGLGGCRRATEWPNQRLTCFPGIAIMVLLKVEHLRACAQAPIMRNIRQFDSLASRSSR